MSDLSEREVLDRLKTSLRDAGSAAVELSVRTRQGPAYRKLRENLLLVEGACRQISAMREDSRWLMLAAQAAEAHRRSHKWLLGYKDPVSRVRILTSMESRHPLFDKLAQALAYWLVGAENLETRATGRVGMILPETPRADRQTGAPVAVSMPPDLQKAMILSDHKGTVH